HQRAGVESRGDRVEIDDFVLDPERVVEAPLGHAPVQRHLAAFEPALELEPRARLRALVAAPGRLPLPGALAAPDALLGVFGAVRRPQIVQRHVSSPIYQLTNSPTYQFTHSPIALFDLHQMPHLVD